eukprot:2050577-Pyramimonas_sp.AAC.1
MQRRVVAIAAGGTTPSVMIAPWAPSQNLQPDCVAIYMSITIFTSFFQGLNLHGGTNVWGLGCAPLMYVLEL